MWAIVWNGVKENDRSFNVRALQHSPWNQRLISTRSTGTEWQPPLLAIRRCDPFDRLEKPLFPTLTASGKSRA